jgi:hypothetical protein
MKKITLLFICLIGNFVFSHTINYENVVLRHWSIEKKHQFIDGSFMMYKNDFVFIEDANHAISKVLFSDLSNQYSNITFIKIDTDNAEELAKYYEVSALPTVLFINDGDVISIIKGFDSNKIKSEVEELNKLE